MTESIALNYREAGSGEPILFMHGIFGSLSNLGKIGRSLAEKYRLIRVDLRNHGDSPHHREMNYQVMADDIIRLMDDLGIESTHLIGHSMGGKVAMQVALDHPDRIKKLVVMDIAPVFYPSSNHDQIIIGLMKLHQQPPASRSEADALLTHFVSHEDTRAFLLTNLVRNKNAIDGASPFCLRLNMPAIVDNYAQHLTAAPSGHSFSGPVLFLKGSESRYIREEFEPAIGKLFPYSQLEVVENASHLLHMEKPDVVAALAENFLSSPT